MRNRTDDKHKTKEAQEASKNEKLDKVGAGDARYQKVVKRLIYGSILFGLLLLLLWLGHLYLCALVIIIQFFLFKELSGVRYKASTKPMPLFRTLMWCCFLTGLFYSYGDMLYRFEALAPYEHYHCWITLWMHLAFFISTVLSLEKGQYKSQMGQFTWTVFSVCFVVFQSKSATNNVLNGIFWFVVPVFLIICNDSMAYFVGKALGRKLINIPFLEVSPNKTYEGFIGGAVFTMLLAFLLPPVLRYDWFICPVVHIDEAFGTVLTCDPHDVFIYLDYKLPDLAALLVGKPTVRIMPVQFHSLVLGVFASFIAPFGGFFASAIKRAYSIKDFDSIIPGHGGFMDRMDCQVLMALCTHVHYRTFIVTYLARTVPEILNEISLLSAADRADLVARVNVM